MYNNNRYPFPKVIRPRVNRKNPQFTLRQFTLFIPAMKQFVETERGREVFDTYKSIANSKVFYSMMGDEWQMAMALCIAHYISLWAQNATLAERGAGATISSVAALGQPKGLLTSLSVGEVSKSYDFSHTMHEKGIDTIFWNQTEYGRQFYAIWAPKQPLGIGLVGG